MSINDLINKLCEYNFEINSHIKALLDKGIEEKYEWLIESIIILSKIFAGEFDAIMRVYSKLTRLRKMYVKVYLCL
jgi:hypothetical protein